MHFTLATCVDALATSNGRLSLAVALTLMKIDGYEKRDDDDGENDYDDGDDENNNATEFQKREDEGFICMSVGPQRPQSLRTLNCVLQNLRTSGPQRPQRPQNLRILKTCADLCFSRTSGHQRPQDLRTLKTCADLRFSTSPEPQDLKDLRTSEPSEPQDLRTLKTCRPCRALHSSTPA